MLCSPQIQAILSLPQTFSGLFKVSNHLLLWRSIFEDITTVQFNHRMFAYLIVVLVLTFAAKALKQGVSGGVRLCVFALIALLVVQVTLGISTLLFYVPVPVAAAHQIGAVALLSVSLFISHSLAHRQTTI